MKSFSRTFAAIPTAISLVLAIGCSLIGFQGVVDGQWVQVGLVGNNVGAFIVSGTNLFAGTGEPYQGGPGEGVFRSSDNGTTWNAVNNGLYDLQINALAESGANLFAGTFATGVFSSTNNGASWTWVSTGLTSTYVNALAVSGVNLFAGTDRGVFRSTDNGASWTAASTGLPVNGSPGVFALTVIGANLFAGTEGGLYLSTNNGTSWTEANTGFSNTYYVDAFAVLGTNLFAGTQGGVYLSTNNGTSWTVASTGLTNTGVNSLAVNGANLFAGTQGGVYLTSNNGKSWTSVDSGLTSSIGALAVSGSYLFAATSNGLWRRPLSDFGIETSADTPYHLNIPYDSISFHPTTGTSTPLNGTITGGSGKPIPNVTIGIEDGIKLISTTTKADKNGNFSYGLEVPIGAAGMYTITASYQGSSVATVISPVSDATGLMSNSDLTSLLTQLQSAKKVSSSITSVQWDDNNAELFPWYPESIPVAPLFSTSSNEYDIDALAYVNTINQNHVISEGTWTIPNAAVYNRGLDVEKQLAKIHLQKDDEDIGTGLEVLGFLTAGAVCVFGAVETGGAACIPLAITIESAAWHNVIDGLVKKGQFSKATRDDLYSLEATANLIELPVSINAPEELTTPAGQASESLETTSDILNSAYDINTQFGSPQEVDDQNGNVQFARVPLTTQGGSNLMLCLNDPSVRTITVTAGTNPSIASKGKFVITSIDSASSFDLNIYSGSLHTGRDFSNPDSLDEEIPGVLHSGLSFYPQSATIVYGSGAYTVVIVGDSSSAGTCELHVVNSIGDSILSKQDVTIQTAIRVPSSIVINADTGIVKAITSGVNLNPAQSQVAAMIAYPNPVSGSETLQYSLADESPVSITIYDLLGRVVASPVVGEMESAGQHETTFDTQGLPPGLYTCRLTGDGIAQSAKMVIAR